MIVPMKRVAVLCLASERESALERLAKFGAVQLSDTQADSASAAEAAMGQAAAEAAAEALSQASSAKDSYGLSIHRAPPEASTDDADVRHVLDVANSWLDARAEATALEAAAAKAAPWGDFDPTSAKKLADEGICVSLFSVSPSQYDEAAFAAGGGVVEITSQTADRVSGVYIGGTLPEGVTAAALPSERLGVTNRKLEEARAKMRMAAGTLRTLSRFADAANASAARYAERRQYAEAEASLREHGPVAYISGWIPGPAVRDLEKCAQASGWGFALRDPAPDEEPPVLLRTPRWAKPIQSLFGMLGILPGYRESDPSVVFYSFFTVFFAMLVGDAGYGALMVGAWWLARRAIRRKAATTNTAPSPFAVQALALLLVFGVAAIVWGVLSGTYFGVPAEWLPSFLATNLPTARWLSEQSNVMHLCFIVGLLHLGIARVWNAIELYPDTKALAQLGWLGVLYGMYNIVCTIVVTDFVYPAAATWAIALGVVLILLFSFKKSELKENAVSLAMTPLNVVSSMGDVISYVRLFAVGLASVQIARTFDTMAAGLSIPLWAKIPCMALILIGGHALNLAMGALSILVHAVRLNTLEFSGAKGVTWSGSAYEPFTARKDP